MTDAAAGRAKLRQALAPDGQWANAAPAGAPDARPPVGDGAAAAPAGYERPHTWAPFILVGC